MIYYEKISDNLIRIKLVSSVNIQEKKLISIYELGIYFELLNDKNNIIPLDEWIYIKSNKRIEECIEFNKLKLLDKKGTIFIYNVFYNKETKNQMITINNTNFVYEEKNSSVHINLDS